MNDGPCTVDRALPSPRSPALLSWLRMARIVNRTLRSASERLRASELSNAQFDLIAQVGAAPGSSQQELADRLLVTQGNVCQLLDGLERKGAVERRRAGRANRVFLTEGGQELAARVVPAHEEWQAERMAALTPQEQHELLRLLRKLDRWQRSGGGAAFARSRKQEVAPSPRPEEPVSPGER